MGHENGGHLKDGQLPVFQMSATGRSNMLP